MVAEALHENKIDRLSVLCDPVLLERLRIRSSSLSAYERSLFDLRNVPVCEQFLHSASMNLEVLYDRGPLELFAKSTFEVFFHPLVTILEGRRIFNATSILYYIRNEEQLRRKYGNITDQVVKENYRDVMIANIQCALLASI